jgi:vacuolar-type H+-ATPase subunit D/Vma8
MSTIKFTRQNMPKSGAELREHLQKTLEKTSLLDDFVQIIKEITQLENHYNMKSEDFYDQFQQGKLGDDIDFVRWATKYEIYQEIKADIPIITSKPTEH